MKSEDEKPQSQAERQAMVPAGKQADRHRPPVWLALLERFSTWRTASSEAGQTGIVPGSGVLLPPSRRPSLRAGGRTASIVSV